MGGQLGDYMAHGDAGGKGPFLGLATTRELLEEVAVRMELTQNSIKGRDLAKMCREAMGNLAAGVLNYRTIDE